MPSKRHVKRTVTFLDREEIAALVGAPDRSPPAPASAALRAFHRHPGRRLLHNRPQPEELPASTVLALAENLPKIGTLVNSLAGPFSRGACGGLGFLRPPGGRPALRSPTGSPVDLAAVGIGAMKRRTVLALAENLPKIVDKSAVVAGQDVE
jgi:hypothetical protein